MMTAAILAGTILITREISYVDEIGYPFRSAACRQLTSDDRRCV
jgi:phage FluMu protein gp41